MLFRPKDKIPAIFETKGGPDEKTRDANGKTVPKVGKTTPKVGKTTPKKWKVWEQNGKTRWKETRI